MIIPFARSDEEFLDDVRTVGNVLHRLRVPRKVEEAKQLLEAGVIVEAYDCLEGAMPWVTAYRIAREQHHETPLSFAPILPCSLRPL